MTKTVLCRFIPALFLACTFAASAEQLSPPVRQTKFSQTAVPGVPAAPKWADGHLIWFRPSTTHSDLSNNFAVHDSEGHAVLETRVWVPGATQVWIRDVEAVEGEAVAVGNAVVGSLPWSSFRCGLHPAADQFDGYAEVRASKDRIGVLLPTCHEWLELNTSGEITGRWSWRDVPITNGLKSSAMVSSVVMTPSNEVFARIGIGLYRLNREQGTWDPVDLTAATDAGAIFGWLAGHDGESLVYLSQRELVRADVRKQ